MLTSHDWCIVHIYLHCIEITNINQSSYLSYTYKRQSVRGEGGEIDHNSSLNKLKGEFGLYIYHVSFLYFKLKTWGKYISVRYLVNHIIGNRLLLFCHKGELTYQRKPQHTEVSNTTLCWHPYNPSTLMSASLVMDASLPLS